MNNYTLRMFTVVAVYFQILTFWLRLDPLSKIAAKMSRCINCHNKEENIECQPVTRLNDASWMALTWAFFQVSWDSIIDATRRLLQQACRKDVPTVQQGRDILQDFGRSSSSMIAQMDRINVNVSPRDVEDDNHDALFNYQNIFVQFGCVFQ